MGQATALIVRGDARCSDGKLRKLKWLATEPSNYFAISAQVNVGKRTVSGFVTTDYDEPYFIAYTWGRNADALPAGRWQGAKS